MKKILSPIYILDQQLLNTPISLSIKDPPFYSGMFP
jgi:hypothetical protein